MCQSFFNFGICSQVYWLGDLNYRITDLTATKVKQCLQIGDMETILKSDQLIQQHTRGRVLSGYTEGPITFQPTYKVFVMSFWVLSILLSLIDFSLILGRIRMIRQKKLVRQRGVIVYYGVVMVSYKNVMFLILI